MSFKHFLLAACLLSSGAALAQTAPSAGSSTTKSTNTVGLGGTIQGSTQDGSSPNGTPARYDDRNSALPSQSQVRMKSIKPKKDKTEKSGKMKAAM